MKLVQRWIPFGGLLYTAIAGADPLLYSVVQIPEVTDEIFYADSENAPTALTARFYYLPTESVIGRTESGEPDFHFALRPPGADLNFSLRLVSPGVQSNRKEVIAELARRMKLSSAAVELLPLPLMNTQVKLSESARFITESRSPPAHLPVNGSFAFFLHLNRDGVSWARNQLVVGGLPVAFLEGEVAFWDPGRKLLTPYAFGIPLRLNRVPFCALVVSPCHF